MRVLAMALGFVALLVASEAFGQDRLPGDDDTRRLVAALDTAGRVAAPQSVKPSELVARCEALAELHYAMADAAGVDADAAWEDAYAVCMAEGSVVP